MMDNKWYNKGWIVFVACIVFPPIGIYAVWRNTKIEKTGKVVFSLVSLVWMFLAIASNNKPTDTVSATTPIIKNKTVSEIKDEEEEVKRVETAIAQAEHPEKYISILSKNVYTGGFGNVALLDCKLKNESKLNYKDIVVKVVYFGESDTEIGSKEEVLYVTIKPNSTKRIKALNLGFAPQQFIRYTIEVLSASVNK